VALEGLGDGSPDFRGFGYSVFLLASFPDWDSVQDWHCLQASVDFLPEDWDVVDLADSHLTDWAGVDFVDSRYCFLEDSLVCFRPGSVEAGFRTVAGLDSVRHLPDLSCPDCPEVLVQKMVCFHHLLMAVHPAAIRRTVSFSSYFLRISYPAQSDPRFSLLTVLLQ
jgi:hypothetical protein